MTVTIIDPQYQDPAALLCRYDGQPRPQPVYIDLDLVTGEVEIGYSPEISGTVPAPVYNQTVHRWIAEPFDATSAPALLRTLAPAMDYVMTGARVVWDGRRHVGVMDEASFDETIAIQATITQWAKTHPLFWVMAPDWFREDSEIRERIGWGWSIAMLYRYYQGHGRRADDPWIEDLDRYLTQIMETTTSDAPA